MARDNGNGAAHRSPLGRAERVMLGAAGGLASLASKYIAQDHDIIVANYGRFAPGQLEGIVIGYVVMGLVLVFLGALAGWVVEDEARRLRVLAMAVALPALITTWAGGAGNGGNAGPNGAWRISLVTEAYAAEPSTQQADPGVLDSAREGIKFFFGIDKQPKRYWVIVGSYPDRDAAQARADALNAAGGDLHAWVGVKSASNGYYPVIVGELLPYQDALALKERALAQEGIAEAYLSPGTN